MDTHKVKFLRSRDLYSLAIRMAMRLAIKSCSASHDASLLHTFSTLPLFQQNNLILLMLEKIGFIVVRIRICGWCNGNAFITSGEKGLHAAFEPRGHLIQTIFVVGDRNWPCNSSEHNLCSGWENLSGNIHCNSNFQGFSISLYQRMDLGDVQVRNLFDGILIKEHLPKFL